jgi:hypothetical protein
MTTAIDLLGRPYQDLSLLPELADTTLPEPEDFDDSSAADFTELGFAVDMKGHVTISQVVLYSGTEGPYAAYRGPLPMALRFLTTPEEVSDLLGPPVEKREAEFVIGIGWRQPWDKYIYDEYALSIHYSLDTGLATMVQIYTP